MSQVDVAAVGQLERLERDPFVWVMALFPDHFEAPFAEHHEEFWDHTWAIQLGVRPDPFVGVWARGGAKSTSAEAAVVALGARRRRRYCLYVSETQDQADDHVTTIGDMLESPRVELFYPDMADREVGKYGSAKGWRRNRLWTRAGFVVDALGLDVGARGRKLGHQRPDLLVFDDLDSEDDTPAITAKKVRTITRKLMPAGSDDVAVLAIQNLVHELSIFAQMVDGSAEFLSRRKVSGPVPAVEDLEVEVQPGGRHRIVAGRPTWEGQDLETCQAQMDDWGFSAFMKEAQHSVEPPPGGVFSHLDWPSLRTTTRAMAEAGVRLVRKVVWVDPAVTNKDDSDCYAVQADALGSDGVVYRLRSWEQRSSPEAALERAILWAVDLGAEHVGVETDQGGDTWESVFKRALEKVNRDRAERGQRPIHVPFTWDKAGAGHGSKQHRGMLMLADYEAGGIRHVEGYHLTLERALHRAFKTKPFDLADVAYWAWQDLRGGVEVDEMLEVGDEVRISPI